MSSGEWVIVSAGVVFAGNEVIWYCITCYETVDIDLPIAA